MKRLILCIVMMAFLTTNAYSACDWGKIDKVGGFHQYSVDCHIEVGKLVKEQKLRKEQVAKLNESIQLKDLAITRSDQRVELWKGTTYKLEDRLMKHDKWARKNDWLLFGGGILTTILTGWAVGQATK